MTHLKAVETPTNHQAQKEAQFAEYVARVLGHPKTPRMVRNALLTVLISDISNNSEYAWHEDREGLLFMLPRLLSGMNNSYSEGITDATVSVVKELLPKAIRDEINLGVGGVR